MTSIKVSKLDVARDQLDAAIELFFTSQNTVATHTLTAAAYNVLLALAKLEGSEYPFLKAGFIDSLSESERSKMWQFINAPENYFKHADRDPAAILEFDPELTELLLVDACSYFRERPADRPKYYDAVKVWSGKIRPDIPDDSVLGLFVQMQMNSFKAGGKVDFWHKFGKLIAHREATA